MKLHIATPDTYEEVLQAVKDRDYQDMNREVEPLHQAEDAILVDSTNMTLDEEVEAVMKVVEEKCKDSFPEYFK